MKFPNIDPIAVELFGISIKWYGIAYVLGLFLGLYYAKFLVRRLNSFNTINLDNLLVWIAIGTVLGGRLGYVFFYDFSFYFDNPSLIVLDIRKGGMSFHGGLLGVTIAIYIYSTLFKLKFLNLVDIVSTCVPIGLFLGRVANFINSELWGKPTNLPWGIIFPNGGNIPRHPTQLYEAILEGFFMFIILNIIYLKNFNKPGITACFFLIIYGLFRFLIELIREPDYQIGYIYNDFITMGMILSLPMVFLGFSLLLLLNVKFRKYN